MAIFYQGKPNPARRAARQIKQIVRSGHAKIADAQLRAMRTFWNHPKATPDQIAKQLGKDDLTALMEFNALASQVLTTVKPGTEVAAPPEGATIDLSGAAPAVAVPVQSEEASASVDAGAGT